MMRVTDNHTDALTATFGFNAVGNLTSITEPSGSSPADITIDYDALGRLTAFKDAPTGTPIEAYTYDATGNRTSFAHLGATQAYTYQATSHRLADVAGAARTYDASGNTLTIGAAWMYTYGAAGRMATANDGTSTATYAYTGAGEQVKRVAGGGTTLFVYDQAGQLLGQYDGTGAPLQQYVWMDALPVGVIAGGQLLHVQADHLGTPRAVIDPTRNIAIWAWPLLGEVFGATAPAEDPDGDASVFVFDLRFPGQRFDQGSGLNQNYFRDYEPSTGRYPTTDPAGLLFSWSTYNYASGSPFITTDPYGLFGVESFDPVFDAIYKATGGASIDGRAVDLITGFGDGLSSVLSLGIYSTADARRDIGIDGGVDRCSNYYRGGTYASYAYSAAFGWVGGLNGGARSVFWSGKDNLVRASQYGINLESTVIGRAMNYFGNKTPYVLWKAASWTFSKNAKGVATKIGTYEGRIWSSIERPLLDRRGIPVRVVE